MKTALYEPGEPTFRVHRRGRTAVIATVSAVLCATSLMAIPSASAAVPQFPDNLVVFPDRDFITIEGYQSQVGQEALIEVTRPNAGVVGSAAGIVQAGEVAFEINHPGGYCWGAGTGLNVTPDILPGDVVSIKFGGTEAGATTVQDTYVTADSTLSGNTVTVRGFVAASVNRTQMEQRIIEPALKDTDVGRRDVRALPGPLTPNEGYSSSLEFGADNTFTATYVFDTAATAEIAAAAAGARSMAWEEQDVDGNRQGLTIAEFGEVGGPGMGGCPNGPLQSGPAGPTNVAAAKVDTEIRVNWTPARAIPGTQPITGYRVAAVSKTINGSEQVEFGMRISDPNAASTTIRGLSATEQYDVYVASVSSVGETFPAIHATAETDSVAPTVSASPNGGTFSTPQQLTLTASEPGSEIYYTSDGADPVMSGGVTSADATLYREPITVSQTGTIRYAAIDPSGNVSETQAVQFTITNDPVPAAPAFTGPPQAGRGTAEMSWTAPDPGAPGLTIEDYRVQAYTASGPVGTPQVVPGDVTTLRYKGLSGDTTYQFTVRASNTHGTGPESAMSEPVTVQGDVVAAAGPDQSITRGTTATTVTLDGSGSTRSGATYQWEQILSSATDPDKVTLNGSTTLMPTFSLPVYRYPMTNNPLTFKLTVTVGSDPATAVVRTDEVKVTPVPDRVAVSQAQWKSRDLRIGGTSSAVGGTITVHRGTPDGPVLGTVTVTAAAAPDTGGEWILRLRNGAAGTSNPGTIYIESTLGGTAGPVTVANR